jgi:hypothetical protein
MTRTGSHHGRAAWRPSRHACKSWSEKMRSDGGSIDLSPTVDQAINDGSPGHQLGKKTRVSIALMMVPRPSR